MLLFKQTIQTVLTSLFLLFFTACSNIKNTAVQPGIIPAPVLQTVHEGTFVLSSTTQLLYDTEFKMVALFLKEYIENGSSIRLKETVAAQQIIFSKDSTIQHTEGYQLNISKKKIEIKSRTQKGAFYGFQSLRQLLPIHLENNSYEGDKIQIQCINIKDAPQFKYRGMHLDVGRHFFSVSFIKKYIDLMSMLKMNTFHWHLTEDQGWRIEIKKYPKLNTVAAYRKETLIGHYSDKPHQFDGKKYGGYYTQEEIKGIVSYATARQITVIPEIEMPGHSQAAISAYPALGCTGKQIEVATKWGVFEDIYCPKESTFQFLEDVIDEVVTLFPGKYIHIGGDEAPKSRWANCKHCQQLIKKEGLKDTHELQSYFISRMEKYINSKGKQIIGWDEILEGGLSPNATVMSWRGTSGAIVAAKQHHDVVLTPGSHCYFDHYQSTNPSEPLAIGGFLPIEKVYNFNPIPEELTKEESKYVLGAQGNVWTEYMPTAEKVEYMAFPRAIALSEAVWSIPAHKNYDDFKNRLINYQKRMNVRNVNYANHLHEVSGKLHTKDNTLSYTLETAFKGSNIRYTTDGTTPTSKSNSYTTPIQILKNTTIKAASFKENSIISAVFTETIKSHKAVGKKITLSVAPNKAYNAGGKQALINGISGSDKRYGDKEWLGFSGKDVTIKIDLGEETTVNTIKIRFFVSKDSWIYQPANVQIATYNVLEKNDEPVMIERFEDIYEEQIHQYKDNMMYIEYTPNNTSSPNEHSRYVEIRVKKFGKIQEGNQGAGNEAWTFIDEIIIE